jgi:hypothetical protein
VRVCLVNTYHFGRGGDSTYTFDLARLLESRGDEVVHFAMKHPNNFPSRFEPYFVNCVDYKAISQGHSLAGKLGALPRSLYSFEARNKFARLLDDTRPDVIHLQNFRRHLTCSTIMISYVPARSSSPTGGFATAATADTTTWPR